MDFHSSPISIARALGSQTSLERDFLNGMRETIRPSLSFLRRSMANLTTGQSARRKIPGW
jgi:hypothetical protein